MATLAEKFEKIKSPKLQNQHHTAVVLNAVEDTLRDQKADFSATAYFAALLALLGQALNTTHGIVNKDLATSVVYLLDITAEDVPAPLLRSKFAQILSSLVPALTLADVEAPLLRPSIGILETLLVAQDANSWALPQTQIGPRRATAGLLNLAVDHRPKVRKRAQDALVKVLKNPPTSPSLDHPAADMCAETALQTLAESVAAAGKIKKSKHGKQERDGSSSSHHEPAIIHALHLVKTVATASGGWPSKKIEPLCELLMNVSRSSNEFITMGAFQVFEVIFEGMADEFSSSKLPRLLEAIQELRPAQNDSQLLPPWIAVLSRGYDVSAQVNPEETFEKLPALFELVASFLSSPSKNIRISASECLISFLANCVPDNVILEPSVYDEKTLEKLAKFASNLLSVKYQAAWMEVFNVCAAMFEAFKWRSTPYLVNIVRTIGELRSNESFHGKKEADEVLGRAVYAMGPAEILNILPLNVIEQKPGQPGRVWLLPILRDNASNTQLAHFRSEMVPLSEALYQRVLEFGQAEKTVEVKIFETIIQQIWSILPGYCELPLDLESAFDQSFAELLSNVLYKQTELRVDVCRALQNLVESTQAIVEVDTGAEQGENLVLQRRISKATARKNLAHLSAFASNLLAVLFNVYSQTLPHYRGYILQCVNAYLSIAPEKELEETFTRVVGMLESELPSEEQAAKQGNLQKGTDNKMPPTSHTLIDLLIAMSIYLPRTSFANLFRIASVVLNRDASDPQLIKKAYKLIPRLATTETGRQALIERSDELQALMLATADKAPSPARRDRLLAIHELVSYLPTSDLHFIPSILPEVILGCKESNDKARTAAFDLLIHLAKRIIDSERNPAGTTIRNSLVPHMPDDTPDAAANLEEFFTMVSAGLAGASPHMVAASVTALSRLFFEYRAELSAETLSNLVETVELFLTSNNREIVRSVLGFAKVAVVCLPEDMLRPRLASLVPNLMVWSKEHKGRLRTKVKGILDRLVRRFGAPLIESLVGEADRKLVVNIRKERERKKRKKQEGNASAADEQDGDAQGGAGKDGRFSNEFDRAVYGSDVSSDDDDDDDDDGDDSDKGGRQNTKQQRRATGKRGSASAGFSGEQYIRELSPESNPLDLLAPDALASISTTKPSLRFLDNGVGKNKNRHGAKLDLDGKLILRDDGRHDNEADGDYEMSGAAAAAAGDGINAYLDAVSGPSAVRRGQKGRLKFGKQDAAASRGDMDIDDDDDGEESKGQRGMGTGSGSGAATNMKSRSGGGGGGIANGRRGLGVPKTHGASTAATKTKGRIEKRRSGSGSGSGRGAIAGRARGRGGRGGRR